MMDIVRMYKSGQSIRQIAEKMGVSKTAIHKRLRREIELRPPVCRKHPINITLITDYRTETCSYWLGYLAHKATFYRTRITLRLAARHIRHLGKFASAVESPLLPSKAKGLCSLSINHAGLIKFYRDNGLFEFRTGDPSKIPVQLVDQRHFLRGMWDSSGIITHNSHYLRMGYSNRYVSIVDFVAKLLHDNGIVSNPANKSHQRYYLWWQGQNAVKVARFLYFNQTISLDYKTSKVLPFLI